jgi:MoxR-like ATPase
MDDRPVSGGDASVAMPELADEDIALAAEFGEKCRVLTESVHRVIVGQDRVVEDVLVCLLGRGHALLIGVPGLGKTLLVKTLASALGWEFKRIQFTPDLMPSDITGVEILQTDQATGARSMTFTPGPVFANLVLADEINRTPPKTQAALLEAMQEHAVTVSGRTLPLSPPFTVIATQNPIEHEGTYPLPEAQLDRFMFSIPVDYPSREEEMLIVDETTSREVEVVHPVFSRDEMLRLQALVRRVPLSRHVLEYAVTLARATRPNTPDADAYVRQYVEWGTGPRCSQCLVLGAKARALLRGRTCPSCEDVRAVAHSVLGHRIIPNYNATGEGITADRIVTRLLEIVPEPSYKAGGA